MLPARATLKSNVTRAGNMVRRHSFFCSNNFCFNFFVLVLKYNKANSNWRHRSALKILRSQFIKCLPQPSASKKHFTNLWQKIFNDDFDASHYFYNVIFFKVA